MKKIILILGFIFSSLSFALVLSPDNVVTPGRTVNGNTVSDRDKAPEVPPSENVLGTGDVLIEWSEVAIDNLGNPITVTKYELRYKLSTDTEYTIVNVPAQYTGYALDLSAGSYTVIIEAFADNGYSSTEATDTFEVL